MKNNPLIICLCTGMLFYACKKESIPEETTPVDKTEKKELRVELNPKPVDPNAKTIFNPYFVKPFQIAANTAVKVFIASYKGYSMTVPGFAVFTQVMDQGYPGTFVQTWDYFETDNQKWWLFASEVNGVRTYNIWNYKTGLHLGFQPDGRAYVSSTSVALTLEELTSPTWSIPYSRIHVGNKVVDIYNNIIGNGAWVGLNPLYPESESEKWVFVSTN